MDEQNNFDSKYRMVLVKACRVAQDEIAAGFVKHVVTSDELPKADVVPVEYSPILHS
jgi:hypothetical protein